MDYRVVTPISYSGQYIPAGALVSDTQEYGERAKGPLPIARLLALGRIVAAPSATPTQKPAEKQAAKAEKKVTL